MARPRTVAPQLNGSVVKAFQILELCTEQRPEITAADAVRELGMNFVTAHRFLRTLEHVGALIADSRGSYRLGYVFADLGDRVLQNDALARVLQPHLNAVTDEIKEPTMATVFRSDMVVCIARAVSPRSLSVDIRVGTQLEAYCTAHGKVWLAFMADHERERYLDAVEPVRFTENTIIDRSALKRELGIVQRRGYAVNNSEREDGIKAIAIPLRTHTGRTIASLSAFGPATRFTDAAMESALAALNNAARDIQRNLYGSVIAEDPRDSR